MMKLFGLTVLCFAYSFTFSQSVEIKISNAVKQLETDSQLKHAIFSLYVVDSKTGKAIFDKNSQIGLAPASCMKVVTSAAAFELLGKDYQFKTELRYFGDITHDTLQGHLFLQSFGDPTFGSPRWKSTNADAIVKSIIKALKDKNIKVITGYITIDESAWETQATPNGWTWEDMGNYYGAGARAFNWNENQYDIFLKTGKKVGDEVEINETKPPLQIAHLVNELTTAAGSGDRSIIYLPEDGSVGFIRGTLPAGESNFKISGSLPDPSQTFLNEFKDALKANSIKFSGDLITDKSARFQNLVMPAQQKTLLTISSPPLDSINYWFLQKSVNLFGEALVKIISYRTKYFAATDTGINIIKDFWNKRGIERSALHNIDGSGLSPANRVTTNALVTVMQFARNKNWFSSFYNALPLQNNIKMKSGYIGGARSYTGYIKSTSGAEYTFSFIINNYDGNPVTVREKMWKLLDILK